MGMIAFLVFLLFSNIITKYIPYGFVGYWDELFFIITVFYWCIRREYKVINKNKCITVVLLTIVVLFGLLSNKIWSYQDSAGAIIRDIVGFLKFPFTFLVFTKNFSYPKNIKCVYKMTSFFKAYLMLLLAFGLISVFVDIGMSQEEIRGGIHPFMFLYSHPTYYTTGIILILILLNSTGDADLKVDIIAILDVILGMRTKGLMFIAVYCFLKYSGKWIKKLKILYWALIVVVIIGVSYSKLETYASYSNSPRESLYRGAFNIITVYFPLGTGFGTYASSLSGKYFSKVYNIIHIAGLYEPDGSISVDIGDAGLPYYIGQFGIIGIILIICAVVFMIKESRRNVSKQKQFSINLFWIMIGISLTSEAILVNNGFELGVILALVCALCRSTKTIGFLSAKRIA